MSPRQTGQIPAKADRQKQREFHDQVLQPLLKQCLQKDCHVLFMDSAHFVLAAFVSIVWCFERVFIKGASGRFRLNVIGVVHAATKEFTGFFNTSYITADSVVQLLQRIAIDYAGKPIYIVLDNARSLSTLQIGDGDRQATANQPSFSATLFSKFESH